MVLLSFFVVVLALDTINYFNSENLLKINRNSKFQCQFNPSDFEFDVYNVPFVIIHMPTITCPNKSHFLINNSQFCVGAASF